jgi:RHS repeat-associated protein
MVDILVRQRWTWSRASRGARRLGAAAMGVVVVAALLWAPPAGAARPAAPVPQVDPVTPGQDVTVSVPPVEDGTRGRGYRPKAPVWPAPGVSMVDIPGRAAGDSLRDGQADRARVWVRSGAVLVGSGAGVARARVEVFDPTAAGMSRATRPVLLRVSRADGVTGGVALTVGVHYGGFAQAYGADWSTRLRLAAVPECALMTPAEVGCQPAGVPSRNDTVSMTVTGPVNAGSLVVLVADSAAGAGDYAATSLKPSATWSAGGSSGDFSWSYPLRVPPPAAGPMPNLSLAYSSQSVDGRHAATNNQPSWVGEGFEFVPGGFIERRYVPCSKDMTSPGHNNTVATDDLCWKRQNATLSMSGRAGELIFKPSEDRWHLRGDDGSRVDRVVEGSREYWRLTTPDGTKYFFGKLRLDGWAAGKLETDSVLSVPVFGNNPLEPCHAGTFAASSCSQPWRWNLDYVVDPHGNTMSLWYKRHTNRYGRNKNPSDAVEYHRDGWVDRVDYGTNNRGGTDTEYLAGGNIQGRVEFGVANRCLSSCTDNANWPDTPLDRECTAAPCNVHTPTFWSKNRLTQVKTRVWNAAATPAAFRDVERWNLTQSFPNPMDSTRAGLWLERISHTGLAAATTQTVPDVQFGGTNINNRVNPGLYGPGMAWWRVNSIRTETGGQITIDYSGVDCTPSSLPVAHTNTRRCFPSIWEPPGFGQVTDWFHKYVVVQITETDLTTKVQPHYVSPTVLHRYDYPEPSDPDPNFRQGAAWHYTDDDGLVDDDTKTWSVWRGYDRVRVTTGELPDRRTFSETRYFRGMHGDKLSTPGSTRTVSVGNSQDALTVPDEDWWAGLVREEIVTDGPGGAEVSGVVNIPWASEPTATRSVDGVTVHARISGIGTQTKRTALAAGGFVKSTSSSTFDSYGLLVQVADNGNDAAIGDERCVKTAYASNDAPTAWLLSYPMRLRSFALACPAVNDPLPSGVGVDDVIFETRISYDGQVWGAVPTKGDATQTQQAKAWSAGAPTAFTTTGAAFDAMGRNVDESNELGLHSTVVYTPTLGGPLTRTVATSPDPDGTGGSLTSHTITTDFDPAYGVAVKLTDPNNRVTETSYDALGRLTEVYRPGRVKNTNDPNTRYLYSLSNTAPTYIRTETLRPNADGYTTAYAIFDGMLRPRQQQTPQPSTGRIVTEMFYDSAGRAYKTYGPMLDAAAPSGALFKVAAGDSTVAGQINITEFDGVSRPTAQITKAGAGTELWRTTTAYGGDRVHVTPPVGATATTAVSDVRGNTVALRQYTDRADVGSTDPADYDETTYTYNRKGQRTRVTDVAGNHWDFGYDLLGRQTSASDPDKGASTSVYGDAGQLLSTTDALTNTLSYAHDNLGRKTSLWLGPVGTGTKRAEWTYDTVSQGKGQLATSTRYESGLAYTYSVGGYNNFYQPTSATITIPTAETGLGGSYQYQFGYTPTGAPLNMRYPQIGTGAGLLAQELVTYTYRPEQRGGLPNELRTNWPGLTNYVTSTTYTSFGEVANTAYDTATVSSVVIGHSYEQYTRRVSQTEVARLAPGGTVAARFQYTYDQAGNVTKLDEVIADDTQCFTYDYARRLTEAWTPAASDCNPAPSTATLGGPAPYWTTWTINSIGNRTQQVKHASSGNTTTGYTYPAAGTARPHAVTGTTTGPASATYTYDNAGNMRSRPTPSAGPQDLRWNPEGRLDRSTDLTGPTTYLYDPNGGRLIRRDPAGKTLYLPGQEVRATGSASTGTRYYSHAGTVCAMRTPAGFTWIIGDRQGSINLTIDPVSQNTTQRRQDPYGNRRGPTTGTWPSALDKGFLGGTEDPSGLTHLGAREYDPLIGRFTSVDPVLDLADPQQWNAYAYANNNPVTYADPTGLVKMDVGKEAGSADVADEQQVKNDQGTPPGSSTTVYAGTGTTLIVYPDGSFTIDGYRIWDYPGAIDPERLALAVNDEKRKGFSREQQANTALMIYGACWADAMAGCSYDYTTYLAGVIQANCDCPASPLVDVVLAEMEAAGAALAVGREGGGRGGRGGGRGAPGMGGGGPGVGRGGGTVSRTDGPPGSNPYTRQYTCNGARSFDGDTEVVLADGSAKPISEIKVGDQILATDPETNTTGARAVTHVWIHDDTVIDLALTGGATVTTTEDHPFWNATDRQWQDAQDIDPGDQLRTSDGRTVTVSSLDWTTAHTDTAYNLTVDTIHTYYVMAEDTPVLVHNCNTHNKKCNCDLDKPWGVSDGPPPPNTVLPPPRPGPPPWVKVPVVNPAARAVPAPDPSKYQPYSGRPDPLHGVHRSNKLLNDIAEALDELDQM